MSINLQVDGDQGTHITLWDVIFYISCKNYSTFYLLVIHIFEIIKVIIVVLQVCKQAGKYL